MYYLKVEQHNTNVHWDVRVTDTSKGEEGIEEVGGWEGMDSAEEHQGPKPLYNVRIPRGGSLPLF